MAAKSKDALDTKVSPRKVSEFRLLLVGKTGSGKSSTGNTILGQTAFPTSIGLQSETKGSSCYETSTDTHRLVVVDTPGFYDTARGNDVIIREIVKIFAFLSPGFHALLFVLDPSRYSDESIKTKELFFKTFGDDVSRYTIIILTGTDRLKAEGLSVDDFVERAGQDFKHLLSSCDNRIIGFNNKVSHEEKSQQVEQLLGMVKKMKKANGGRCFSNTHFQAMAMYQRVGRRFGKSGLAKARKVLYQKISARFGVTKKYAWNSQDSSESRARIPIPTSPPPDRDEEEVRTEVDLTDIQSLLDSSEEKYLDDEDLGHGVLEDRALLENPSYLDRLVHFFVALFLPVYVTLFGQRQL